MIQPLRNARLMIGVIGQHLTDDPFLLGLQVSRRLPRIARPIGRLIRAVYPAGSTAVPVVLAALSAGADQDVRRRLQLAVDGRAVGEKARRLADVAISANLPDLADTLLVAAAAGNARGLGPARARRRWHDGDLDGAVSALAGSGPAGQRQRARLAGEAAVFAGAAPSLGRQEFVPTPGRVLHLLTNSLPHTSSGYAQRSHSILAAQQEAGWEVLAVTRLAYPVQVGKILARAEDVVDGVRYRRLLPGRLAPAQDGRLQQQAEELLAVALEFKPAVIHTTTHFVNGLVVRAVAEALGIPWVYEVRGQLADTWAATRGPEARLSQKYRQFADRETAVMRAADLVVTLGTAMKANIVAAGVDPDKVLLAPNGVGGAFLQEPREARAARRELGLPEHGQYVGTVSSLVAYEGIDVLIAAFARLAPRHPGLYLLIVGDGVSGPSLREQAGLSGFGDRIMFTGRVPRDQAVVYHQALDVFVVPRKSSEVTRSVTPLKPVEAMACSRPVVASGLPALSEIVEDEVTGLLADAGDPASLAAVLGALLRAPQSAAAMGAAGRERVLRERTWAANIAALAERMNKLGVSI